MENNNTDKTSNSLSNYEIFCKFLGLDKFLSTHSPIVTHESPDQVRFQFSDDKIKILFGAQIDRSNLVDIVKSENEENNSNLFELSIRFRENLLVTCYDNRRLEEYCHFLEDSLGARFVPYFSKSQPHHKPTLCFYGSDEKKCKEIARRLNQTFQTSIEEVSSRNRIPLVQLRSKDMEKIAAAIEKNPPKDFSPAVSTDRIHEIEKQRKLAVIPMLKNNIYFSDTVDWSISSERSYKPNIGEIKELLEQLMADDKIKKLILDNTFLYLSPEERKQVVRLLSNIALNNNTLEMISLNNNGLASAEDAVIFYPFKKALEINNKHHIYNIEFAEEFPETPEILELLYLLRTPPSSPSGQQSAETQELSPVSQGKKIGGTTDNLFAVFQLPENKTKRKSSDDSEQKNSKKQKKSNLEHEEIKPLLPTDFFNYQRGGIVPTRPPIGYNPTLSEKDTNLPIFTPKIPSPKKRTTYSESSLKAKTKEINDNASATTFNKPSC